MCLKMKNISQHQAVWRNVQELCCGVEYFKNWTVQVFVERERERKIVIKCDLVTSSNGAWMNVNPSLIKSLRYGSTQV